jgi:hypothetical protein
MAMRWGGIGGHQLVMRKHRARQYGIADDTHNTESVFWRFPMASWCPLIPPQCIVVLPLVIEC